MSTIFVPVKIISGAGGNRDDHVRASKKNAPKDVGMNAQKAVNDDVKQGLHDGINNFFQDPSYVKTAAVPET
ncbi:hypothetical protein JCM14469_06540 [Desulfatiferula olefinivorans]